MMVIIAIKPWFIAFSNSFRDPASIWMSVDLAALVASDSQHIFSHGRTEILLESAMHSHPMLSNGPMSNKLINSIQCNNSNQNSSRWDLLFAMVEHQTKYISLLQLQIQVICLIPLANLDRTSGESHSLNHWFISRSQGGTKALHKTRPGQTC